MRPTFFLKGIARIVINLLVRGKFTTRLYDIFMEKDSEEKESEKDGEF